MIAAARLRKGSTTAWTVPLLEEDWDAGADYSDICASALRDGRIEVAEAYGSHSGDGWRAFKGRHGTQDFDFDWEKHWEAERRRLAEARRYEAERQAREAARRHERQVAAKLEADQQWWDGGLGQSERERLAKLQPSPKPKPRPIVPVWYVPSYYTQPLQQENVEPWFRPDRQLTRDDLIQIARYALSYFTAALRKPWSTQSTAGWQVVTAICARDADAIAGTLYPLAQGVPLHACLSRLAVAIPGVALETDGGAIRVTLMEDGRISMVLSYDA